MLTGDVAGGLAARDILRSNDSGPYYIAQRGANEKDKEFMATPDSWFRPAGFASAPDGYLCVIDMYRQHIGTPPSIPEDLQKGMDFNAGHTMGRIYRIVPGNAGPYKPVTPNLGKATSAELVTTLTHQNRWWRLTAQRLLLERQDKSVIPAVKDLFAKNEDPRFRLHALYVLEGMDALDADIVKAAMKDPSPGVRENAAILSERFPACLSQLEEMVKDSDIRVAYQATLSLGQFKDNSIAPALEKSLELHGTSSWFRNAVLSSEVGSGTAFSKTLESTGFFKDISSWKTGFFETYANVIGNRNDKGQITGLLNALSQPSIVNAAGMQAAGIKGLIKGLERIKDLDASLKEKLKPISSEAGSDVNKAVKDLKELFAK